MKLGAYEPGMALKLDDFYQAAVGGCAGHFKPGLFQELAVVVVQLEAVAIALFDFRLPVSGVGLSARYQLAKVLTPAHGVSLSGSRFRPLVLVHNGIRCIGIEFGAVGLF